MRLLRASAHVAKPLICAKSCLDTMHTLAEQNEESISHYGLSLLLSVSTTWLDDSSSKLMPLFRLFPLLPNMLVQQQHTTDITMQTTIETAIAAAPYINVKPPTRPATGTLI